MELKLKDFFDNLNLKRFVPSVSKMIANRLNARELQQFTRKELYTVAQDLDIAGRSQMSKDELIKAIKQNK